MDKKKIFNARKVILTIILGILFFSYLLFCLWNCEGVSFSGNSINQSKTELYREYAEILISEKYGSQYSFTSSGTVYTNLKPYVSIKTVKYDWFCFTDSESGNEITVKHDENLGYFYINPGDAYFLIPAVDHLHLSNLKSKAAKLISNGRDYEFISSGIECTKYPPHTIDVIDYIWFEFSDTDGKRLFVKFYEMENERYVYDTKQ